MQTQRGAVSLFVVIFAMLIITVVTVSFLRLMLSDQNQASDANLAEGARNSALAGVEDGKRALLRYVNYCESNADCISETNKINSTVCNQAVLDVIGANDETGGSNGRPGEVKVQQTTSNTDSLFEQAYTCVTIKLDTDDFLGNLSPNTSQIVPLRAGTDFDRVLIQWYSRDDISSGNQDGAVNVPDSNQRRQYSGWPADRPPLLRTQLFQYGDNGFTLEDFDVMTNSGRSNANTLFLYPTNNGFSSSQTQSFTGRDIRKNSVGDESPSDSASDTPLPIRCETSLASGGYACSATLLLPTPIGGGERTSYLRLTPFYNATHFSVKLMNGVTPVQFSAVQPEIDSTGRANNVFKRVKSRVDLYNTIFPFPNAAVDVTGNLCKDYAVTDTEYIPGDASCTP